MTGYAPDGAPQRKERDPVIKLLAGCAIAAGALVALVVIVVGIGGWLLVRDTTPLGRAEEPFLLESDTAYWCFDLRPDDPGLRVLLEHLQVSADRLREASAPDSPFAHLRVPRQQADLDQIFPMRVEIADAGGGWAARLTMGRQVLRMRAAVRIARWAMTRDSRQARNDDVDGVTMTTLTPHGAPVAAFAMVGPRFLVAKRPERLRDILSQYPPAGTWATRSPVHSDEIERLHAEARRENELGWGFRDMIAIPESPRYDRASHATASFVLAPTGALDLEIFATGTRCDHCGLFELDASGARAIVAALVPGLDPSAIDLAEGSPRRTGRQDWRIEATIPDIPQRLDEAFARMIARHAADRVGDATASPAPEPPSATPLPPSPPSTSGPRSGTPGAPRSGGSPTPPR